MKNQSSTHGKMSNIAMPMPSSRELDSAYGKMENLPMSVPKTIKPREPPEQKGAYGKMENLPMRIPSREKAVMFSLGLQGIVDERSFEAIHKELPGALETVHHLPETSFNEVYDARHRETGQPLVVKATNNPLRARIEARAGHFFSQHDKIGSFVQRTLPEPFEYNGLYITVQEKNEDQTKYDIYRYMTALGVLHAHGKKALEGKVDLPQYQPKPWDSVIAAVPPKFKHLENLYTEITREQKGTHVIHSDTKPDNLKFGKLLDLEGLSKGKPATDVSLYLLMKAPLQDWNQYIMACLQTYEEETGETGYVNRNFERFSKQVKRIAVATGLKELSGLYSRPMGDKEKRYIRILEDNVQILAKQQTQPTWMLN